MFELYNLFLFLCFFLVFIWTKTDEKNENCIWNICVVNTSWSVPNSWLITGFVTRLTRRMPLVERELPTLPEHLSSCPVFSGVRVARSLVLCVCFVDRCLSFCIFFFWTLCCLSFDILILITPLVSSNSSYYCRSVNFISYSLLPVQCGEQR